MDTQSTKTQKPATPIPAEIRVFLEGLLKDAGITTLEEEVKEEMIKELFVQLENYLTSVIVDKLPPEHLDSFIKLNEEKKSMAETQQFLKDKLPNAQELFTRAFADFRDLYLGGTTVAQTVPVPATKT